MVAAMFRSHDQIPVTWSTTPLFPDTFSQYICKNPVFFSSETCLNISVLQAGSCGSRLCFEFPLHWNTTTEWLSVFTNTCRSMSEKSNNLPWFLIASWEVFSTGRCWCSILARAAAPALSAPSVGVFLGALWGAFGAWGLELLEKPDTTHSLLCFKP